LADAVADASRTALEGRCLCFIAFFALQVEVDDSFSDNVSRRIRDLGSRILSDAQASSLRGGRLFLRVGGRFSWVGVRRILPRRIGPK